MIKFILLDAANTIIQKPDLWEKILTVLNKNGYDISLDELRKKHKLVSEFINFPDRTDEEFYHTFNSELLFALGIIPNTQLLQDVFKACTYLPWKGFDDANYLNQINLPKAVLSNFNSTLDTLLKQLLDVEFNKIIASEKEKIRKPDVKFYQLAIDQLNVNANEILYIGDSIKLDMQPAKSLNMNVCLIDRDNLYPGFKNRISSFKELDKIIADLNN